MNSTFANTVGMFPEPHPDWPTAMAKWKWGWNTHIYGFGSLFTILIIYDVMVVLFLNRRLRTHPFLLEIIIVVFVFSATKVIYLLIDPYGSAGILSVAVLEVLYGWTYPSLAAMLGALEISILGMTKGNTGLRKSRTQKVFCLYVILHFSCSALTYTWASIDNKLHLLIMLSQGLYVTSGLTLCCIFVYNGYRVTEFTAETNRVLKQIQTYSRVRRGNRVGSGNRELALTRICKPKHLEMDRDSIKEYDSGAESSDNLSIYQDDVVEVDEEDGISCVASSYEHPYLFNRSQLKLDLSSESDYVTEILSPINCSKMVGDSPECLGEEKSRIQTFPKISKKLKGIFVASRKGQRSTRSMSFTKVPSKPSKYLNGKINSAFDKDSQCGSQLLAQDGEIINDRHSSDTCRTMETSTSRDPIQDDNNDGGYMADTEVTLSRKKKSKQRTDHRTGSVEDEDSESSHIPPALPLPAYTGYLGLHRIRQGRLLRKVHKLTYVAVVLVFCTCVLQVYAMFGDLGVLSKHKIAEPWPWFIYHSLCRSAEWSAAAIMVFVAHRLGSHRSRPRKKRKSCNSYEVQTRC